MTALNQQVRHRTKRSTSQTNEYTSQTSSFCQLIERRLHSAHLLLSKNQTLLKNKIIIECNNKSSQSGRDCLCLVEASTKSRVPFTRARLFTNYCHLASAERRTLYSCQFHLSLKCLLTRCLVSYQIHHI